jgi:hypothetical protein
VKVIVEKVVFEVSLRVRSMIRCWSSAFTPFLFRPSLEQIACSVLLSMPEFFTNRT